MRFTAILLTAILASGGAMASQLERQVVQGVRLLDHRITLPELPTHDLVVIKTILDASEFRDDEKKSMIRRHLQKVKKFGTGRGTVFGMFQLGVQVKN